MPCYYPLTAWKSRNIEDTINGKSKMVFQAELGLPNTKTLLPCGQCIGCRLDRAKTWAIRCMHEASLHDNNCFLTLTYATEHLPANGSLDKRDFVLFMKRLRKHYGSGIRFFQCGEYGEELQRPHHHAICFGIIPSDCRFDRMSFGYAIYRSETIERLWSKGIVWIGSVTFDSACYVARYIMKKINGPNANEHYHGRIPEYVTMSRRPGVGRLYYDKYKDDLYNHDKCVVRHNFVLKPPKYYDTLFDIDNPVRMATIKASRKASAIKNQLEPERLEILEKIRRIKHSKTSRNLEGEPYKI
jgi:hypothetical protein